MTMNFAGLTPTEISMVGEQIDLVDRVIRTLAALADPAKLRANAERMQAQEQSALAAMAKAADAQLALDGRENALNTRERALEVRSQDLTRKESEVDARAAAITRREENWHQAVAAVRGVAA
jgi:hypothetical protein